MSAPSQRAEHRDEPEATDADVVIVGGGPAGCVLANRLSADGRTRVLLLEAGPDAAPGSEHPDVRDPFPISSSDRAFHWPGLRAASSPAPAGDAPSALAPFAQGYGIGGGSNVNGMGADRGLPADYDEWQALGADGWNWEAVLPFFRKLERDQDFPGPNSAALHGTTGPLPIRRLPRARWAPFAGAVADTLEAKGYPSLEDYNGEYGDGFGAAPSNNSADQRVSAAMAYLPAVVRARRNLTIRAGTRALRVRIEQGRVGGVDFAEGGRSQWARAPQVVLAAGAIQTPALLMRSGIGDGAALAGHGIPLVHHLPAVGANLQNHPYILLAAWLPAAGRQPQDNPFLLQHWLRFSSGVPDCAPHDMHMIPVNKTAWHALGRRVGAIGVSVFRAYSKGQVALRGADPLADPEIRMNLLGDRRDEDRLVLGLRFILELMAAPDVRALRRQLFAPTMTLIARLAPRNRWNALRAHVLATMMDRAWIRTAALARWDLDADALRHDDAALRDFVRRNAQAQYHVCGTCRMGRSGDPEAVVDPSGRVFGVEGLRVVDASIFPVAPRANTHLSVLMAAEKIAAGLGGEVG